MMTVLRGAFLAAGLLTAGCGTYRQDYSYEPAPAVGASAPPRVLASVCGVLRDPPGVDVRLRLEAGAESAEVVREELRLLTADLVALELVSVEPAGGMVAPARGAETWRLVFAFPTGRDVGSLDLTGLVLSWNYRSGAETAAGSVRFGKVAEPIWYAPYDHGPWWHGPWGHRRLGWYHY